MCATWRVHVCTMRPCMHTSWHMYARTCVSMYAIHMKMYSYIHGTTYGNLLTHTRHILGTYSHIRGMHTHTGTHIHVAHSHIHVAYTYMCRHTRCIHIHTWDAHPYIHVTYTYIRGMHTEIYSYIHGTHTHMRSTNIHDTDSYEIPHTYTIHTRGKNCLSMYVVCMCMNHRHTKYIHDMAHKIHTHYVVYVIIHTLSYIHHTYDKALVYIHLRRKNIHTRYAAHIHKPCTKQTQTISHIHTHTHTHKMPRVCTVHVYQSYVYVCIKLHV